MVLAGGLFLMLGRHAFADPMYTAIDLGTGAVHYGADSGGGGTVIGSNGQIYTFNPVQNDIPSQWMNTTQGVPTVNPAPVGSPDTFGNPNFAFSTSHLLDMNSQGLAVGINVYGVSGHLADSTAFITQRQPDGSWGAPTPIWSGAQTFAPSTANINIFGISPSGQVLGFGVDSQFNPQAITQLYLFDATTHALTNLTSLIDSIPSTNSPQGSPSATNWMLSNFLSKLDDQGRILVEVEQGFGGPVHYLLLVPDGVPSDPIPVPEPTSWAGFALAVGGWLACRRLRARSRGN
jgi:hypothetical protein